MANIGTLAAKLVLDPSVWMTGLDKAADRLNRFTSGIKHVIDEPAKGLGKLFGEGASLAGLSGIAAPAAVAVGALYSLGEAANRVFAELTQIGRASDRLGVSVENFQALMRFTRTGGDELTASLTRMERAMSQARAGGAGVSEAFHRLGIDAGEAIGPNEAILQLMEGFKNIKDPIERTALSMQIFGRSGGAMGAELAKGSEAFTRFRDEAVAAGMIASAAQVRAAREAAHAWRELEHSLAAIKRETALSVASPLASLGQGMAMMLGDVNRGFASLAAEVGRLTGRPVQVTAAEDLDRMERLTAGLSQVQALTDRIHEATAARQTFDPRGGGADVAQHNRFLAEINQLEEQRRRWEVNAGAVARYDEAIRQVRRDLSALETHAGGRTHISDGDMHADLRRQLDFLQGRRQQLVGPLEQIDAAIRRADAAARDFANSTLDKLNAELRRSIATIGMSAEEIHVWEMQLMHIDPDRIRAYRDRVAELEDLKVAQDVGTLAEQLERSIDIWGMNADQVARYDLAVRGATDAQLHHIDALIAQHREMELIERVTNQLLSAGLSQETRGTPAALAGSQAALSAIAAHERQDRQTNIQERIRQLLEEARAKDERKLQLQQQVLDAIRNNRPQQPAVARI